MYLSSARKNFLDILSDPTAIAILASISLHAGIGSVLPFFTQPEKTGKTDGPATVKVVELTPSELQRIPQIPKPKPATPPVTQTVPSNRPGAVGSRPPQFSTSPQAIPFSPIRKPAATATPKPATKQPKTTLQPAKPPVFDPNIFTEPTPTKSPVAKGTKPKPIATTPPTAKPQPKKPKVATSPSPQPDQPMDYNGTGLPPDAPVTTPQAQKPTATPSATPRTPTPQTTPPSNPTGNSGGNGFYGSFTQIALQRLIKYQTDLPGLVVYVPKTLIQRYPAGIPCTKNKESSYIVYMVAFDKVPESNPDDILNEKFTPAIDDPSIYGNRDNKDLLKYAAGLATEAATTADKNRPAADKGKRVLYQYRVEFDPKTCKN